MSVLSELNLGIVGACGRGGSFRGACKAADNVRVHAICDTNVDGLEEAAERLGADEQYSDYETMLERSELDAVIIGTPMPHHTPQSILALKRGLHVISEVPAAVSVQECRDLVAAAEASGRIYMMAENFTYMMPNILVRELVRAGLFGTPYYAEGEYLHELKGLNEITTWRRKWQTGIAGVTYGTHSLGPVLQWLADDRVAKVACAGSGHHYRDPRGDHYENDDSTVMLCQMRSGGLVKIRVDMLSDRPHAMANYQLQGTDGCYESSRGHGGADKIWLREKAPDSSTWIDLQDLADEYLPDWYVKGQAEARKAGHGGGDYYEIIDFLDAVNGVRPCPIGIHQAMDITLPGLVSQESMLRNGEWLDVPDSRTW